jgi:FAD/FMN-containing dehydrogenase
MQDDSRVRFWEAHDVHEASDLEIRATVPKSKTATMLRQVVVLSQEESLRMEPVVYPTLGLLLARLSDGDVQSYASFVQQARQSAVDAGGSLVVTRASADLKAQLDVWGKSPAPLLMRSLKHEFDPNSVLNPGRFVGAI